MSNIKYICRDDKTVVEMDELEWVKADDPHKSHNVYWIQRPTLKEPEEIIQPVIDSNGHIEMIEAPAPSLDEDIKQIKDVIAALNTVVFERNDVIRALFLSVIARQHILMYGLPGTGKNWLVQKFSECIEHEYWEYQISQNTVLEELYGAWDLIAMRDTGKMVRSIDGTLLQAEVAFLDEIGNSSSPIRNALKWLMNERKYRDADEVRIAPIQTIVSASNSVLEFEDATEAAFEDRFLSRIKIPDQLEKDESMRAMLMLRNKRTQLPVISHEVITRLQAAVTEVQMSDEFASQAIALRRAIATDSSAGNLNVSDRRFGQTMELAAANAILSGRKKLRRNDLLVCGLTFWKDPDTANQLADYLKIHLTTNLAKIEQLAAQVEDIYGAFKQATEDNNDVNKMQQSVMSQAQLKALRSAVQSLRRTSEDSEETEAADAIEKKILEYVTDMARRAMDFDDIDLETLKKV